MLQASDEQKRKLRKVKGVAGKLQDIARNTLVGGTIAQGAYIQFGSDLRTYNLWEALLYAKGYEDKGDYAEGSTQCALDAVLKAMHKAEVKKRVKGKRLPNPMID
jgi:hypothetical protein